MGMADAERVHESDGVVGHIVQRVGNVWASSGHDLRKQRARVRSWLAGEMGRLADVAVVEPDDAKSFRGQSLRRAPPARR